MAVALACTVAPAVAAPAAGDEYRNADEEPSGDAGPRSVVGSLVGGVVGFLGDFFGVLAVPNFVKGLFGASTC